jgi:hypothetical protein
MSNQSEDSVIEQEIKLAQASGFLDNLTFTQWVLICRTLGHSDKKAFEMWQSHSKTKISDMPPVILPYYAEFLGCSIEELSK